MRICTARKFAFLRNIKAVLLAITVVAAGATVAHAAESDGTVDTGWASNGISYGPTINFDGMIADTKVLTGDKILALANISLNMAGQGFALYQTTSTGIADTSFSGDGYLKVDMPVGNTGMEPGKMTILSDGSILVVGHWYNNTASTGGAFLAKVTSAGVLDSTFGTNGIVLANTGANNTAAMYTTYVAASGNIYVLSSFNAITLVRFTSAGALDTSGFGTAQTPGYSEASLGTGTYRWSGFTIDETSTPKKIMLWGAKSWSGDFTTSRWNMAVTSGRLAPDTADSSFGTNGYVLVSTGWSYLGTSVKSTVLSPSGVLYMVGSTSGSGQKLVALTASTGAVVNGFGTSGIKDLTTLNWSSYLSTVIERVSNADVIVLLGSDSNYRAAVAKLDGSTGAAVSGFGTAGVSSLTSCPMLSFSMTVRLSDGSIIVAAGKGDYMNHTYQFMLVKLGTAGSTSSCGTTTTTSTTLPQNNNNGPQNNLPAPVATVVEEPGAGIRVTISNLSAGARLGVLAMPVSMGQGPMSEYPSMTEFAVGATSGLVTGIRYESNQGAYIRTALFQAGVSYRITPYQLIGTTQNMGIPTAMGMGTMVTKAITANVTNSPTTTVPSTSVASGAGVTVTDPTVYSASAPTKVSADSAITVMTPAQAKTNDIVTKTPDVCLPANDDIVFIDTGKCIAQIVNEKTGKVLRTLRTTVVEDEVTQLNVGNEVAVLAPVYFESGSTALNAAAAARLKAIKAQVSAAGTVLLVGHSGIITGDTPENRALSKARAVAVANGLKAIKAKGPFYVTPVGAADPAVKKKTEAAQAKNRRVVIVLVP